MADLQGHFYFSSLGRIGRAAAQQDSNCCRVRRHQVFGTTHPHNLILHHILQEGYPLSSGCLGKNMIARFLQRVASVRYMGPREGQSS